MVTSEQDETWRTYDDFAAGIDTYRQAPADCTGQSLVVRRDGWSIDIRFDDETRAQWTVTRDGAVSTGDGDYDAVRIRPDVLFVNLPGAIGANSTLTLVVGTASRQVLVAESVIGQRPAQGEPRVTQGFHPATLDGGTPTGTVPAPSRDLIGRRNLYRYSPQHLYEHIYVSSRRYAWQCLEGVQRGHGDMDLSTVWKFADDLYLFCFREFRIAVASVWLHDFGPARRTVGVFLGVGDDGSATHAKAGGHIIPLSTTVYPDTQPV